MRAALFRGPNLDVARVMGVLDSAVRVARAKPLLGRPAIEGVATLSRQNRSNNDLHGGSLSAVFQCRSADPSRSTDHSAKSPNKHVNWLTLHPFLEKPALPRSSLHGVTARVRQRCSGMSYILKSPTSASSTEISPEKLISFES